MFRKPMRLEKWIAFDGTAITDLAEAITTAETTDADQTDNHNNNTLPNQTAPDETEFINTNPQSDDNDTDTDETPQNITPLALNPSPYALNDVDIVVTIDNDTVELSYPSTPTNDTFTFSDATFDCDTLDAEDFFFEITAPDNGDFTLWDANDTDGFAAAHNPAANKWYAFDNGDNTFVLLFYDNFTFSKTDASGHEGGSGQLAYSENGALRFQANGNTDIGGENVINTVLKSVVFTPNDGSSTPASGYAISGFYKENAGDNPDLFHSNGVYNNNAPDVTVITNDPSTAYDNQGKWDNETATDNTITNPVNPPGGDGDGDSDSGDDNDNTDADSDSGNEAGGNAPPFVFHREETPDENGDDRTDSADDAEDEPLYIETTTTEDGAVESAASALAVELVREVEALLNTVRGDRQVLLHSLTALQAEYLRHGFGHTGPIRDFLRELFEMGEREKKAINRVMTQMRRQMDAFSMLSPQMRDGMLIESLRELVESAERRRGEMGALSQALEAVVKLLGQWKNNGDTPNETDARTLFERVYADALAEWNEKAERLDPMGRDLTASERK